VPAPPVFVAQVTVFTPTLSLAVPLNASDDAEVETDVDDGIEIVSVGGVVSPVPVVVVVVVVGVEVVVLVVAVVVDAVVRVTTAVCETCVTLSLAVTVIVFDPIASGRFITLHALPMIAAVPEGPWPALHVTATDPFPPEIEPERFTLDAVVLDGVVLTVKASAAGVGVAVGVVDAAGALVCAA
jgi:hypothetical protein